MSKSQTPEGGTAAQLHLSNNVNQFLFDLKNEATEHGFKTGESWNLELATDMELTDLKRFHYPVISLRLDPSTLLNVYRQVKGKLNQQFSADDVVLTSAILADNDKKFIAAFPNRIPR